MFVRASLRQHATLEGVEIPRHKRQARSTATIGVQKDRGEQVEFYGILTIDRDSGEPDVFVTVDSEAVSTKFGDAHIALTPRSAHPVTVRVGNMTVLLRGSDMICVVNDKAVRLRPDVNGNFVMESVGEGEGLPISENAD